MSKKKEKDIQKNRDSSTVAYVRFLNSSKRLSMKINTIVNELRNNNFVIKRIPEFKLI